METKRIFEGLKIADFTWMGVGPISMKFIANMGATVIHIESNTRPDITRQSWPFKDAQPGINRSGFFTLYNDSKYGITLNLKMPQAQKVARKLVWEWADVVADAHLPGIMEKWGLDYQTLRKEKPDLIHIATALQGKTGPYSSMPGHGIAGVSLAGFSEITGWPDREPAVPTGAYSDFITFPHFVTALISALIYRKKTGKGQYIELSQLETSLQFLAPPIMDYMINGRIMTRTGNRSTHEAPHGIYRCQGDDRWCAIAVGTDEEWRNFCNAIDNPEWTRNPKFATLRARKENEDELNERVEEWTVNFTPEEVMSRLQEAQVPAGVVSRGEDVVADPQLNHRGTYWVLEHQEIGPNIYQAPPYRFSKTPAIITMPTACMGQHNEYVLKEILGMSDDEVADLLIAGALE
ncbi:MAG: CoA transferase [Dehalococcoidia bacterium]|nr:MAG: CoA transferase [Dehalococcoidia bacterium]